MDPNASLTLSIPVPRDRHDSLLREILSPLLREIDSVPELDAAYFERFNKPDWGIRLHLLGAPGWIETVARPLLERRIGRAVTGATFVAEEPDDKWVGGLRDRERLKEIHHRDTLACLERLEVEARGALGGNRAQFSLLVVERLLDLFDLSGPARLEFYRRGFRWEVDLGRWDGEVFEALDRQYGSQEAALRAALDARPDEEPAEPWGGAESAGIALRLLDSVRPAVDSILAARDDSRLDRELLDLVLIAAHAHSNRLGIHATQEATLRYLAWRARGGGPGGAG